MATRRSHRVFRQGVTPGGAILSTDGPGWRAHVKRLGFSVALLLAVSAPLLHFEFSPFPRQELPPWLPGNRPPGFILPPVRGSPGSSRPRLTRACAKPGRRRRFILEATSAPIFSGPSMKTAMSW